MRIFTDQRIVPLRSLRGPDAPERIPGLHGRTVLSSGGSRIGEVEELLVDADTGEVVYLDVALDSNLAALRTPAPGEERRHVLIPFRYAWFDEAGDEVFVEGLRSQDVGELPDYQGTLSQEMEAALDRWFGRGFVPGRPRP